MMLSSCENIIKWEAELPSLDYEGDNRIFGDHADMGADEYTANLIDRGDVKSLQNRDVPDF